MFSVEFEGTGLVGVVESGSTIFEAAQKAGLYIGSICGGEGVCGKCRCIVLQGKIQLNEGAYIEDNDIQKGYVLACRTEVQSDLRVLIPDGNLTKEVKPRYDEEQERLSAVPGIKEQFSLNPMCRKGYIELPKPSLDDNISDLDRIKREIDRSIRIPIMKFEFDNIRTLADIIRNADFKVTVTYAYKDGAFEVTQLEPGDRADFNYGMAVDIGTTTIMANLVNLNNGEICATASTYNSQMQYGADVITRIIYSQEKEGGLEELNRLVIDDINMLTGTLALQSGINIDDINYMVCTGNTVMIHLLLGIKPDNIRREPYIPVFGEPPAVQALKIGIKINKKGYLRTLSNVGAYVGSDITAAILASGMARSENFSLLIDVGTNGEIVLGNREWLISCSASAGPSFEGAGTLCGMRASPGAIEKVRIHEDGTIEIGVFGGKGKKPIGICGSGYIDLIAELFGAGILDRTGRFRTDSGNSRVRQGEHEMEFLVVDKKEADGGEDIVITHSDISSLIRTKGAIYTAAEAILNHVGLTWAEIETLFISGGFGNCLDVKRSIMIGLLPDIETEKIRFIGNGSIAGGQICLLSIDALILSKRIVRSMTYFDLSTDNWFMNEYTSSIFLPHTNLDKFPTVKAKVLT